MRYSSSALRVDRYCRRYGSRPFIPIIQYDSLSNEWHKPIHYNGGKHLRRPPILLSRRRKPILLSPVRLHDTHLRLHRDKNGKHLHQEERQTKRDHDHPDHLFGARTRVITDQVRSQIA